MRIIYNALVRARNLVVGFVPIFLAAAIAAVNTVTDRSVKGYVFALVTAAATVFVSPAFQAAELKAKIVPPTVDEIVAAKVEAALRLRDATQSVAPSVVAVDLPVAPVPTPRDPAAPVST